MENSRNDYEAMDRLMDIAEVVMRLANEDYNDCSHAHRTFKDGSDFCDINDRICPLEANMKCEAYRSIENDNGE